MKKLATSLLCLLCLGCGSSSQKDDLIKLVEAKNRKLKEDKAELTGTNTDLRDTFNSLKTISEDYQLEVLQLRKENKQLKQQLEERKKR